ncbi:hypothetical protein MK805_17025 [Shimazuella sp. AN120528]|uniref:hypothetical protein n=1 Tax=Shimazuella soli TaxID=1892854 RepID=UPI001F0E9B0F|nr:hypothetical protein [Shimazuella soli]MCH5586640.1 hypothetical protein [Shimazuella soli]
MTTRRRAFLTGFTLSTIGFATFLLADKRNRHRLFYKLQHLFEPNASTSYQEHNQELKRKIGNPEPCDERDNNMVWEGSMYSVKYYNEEKDSHDQ